MSHSGIYIKPWHRGKFTEEAKRHQMTPQQYAHVVLANPHASEELKKEANFARNVKKWHHGK